MEPKICALGDTLTLGELVGRLLGEILILGVELGAELPDGDDEGSVGVEGEEEPVGASDGSELGTLETEGGVDGLSLGLMEMLGEPLSVIEGEELMDGEVLGLSSTNSLSKLSDIVKSTEMILGSPPSLSLTSTKPGRLACTRV